MEDNKAEFELKRAKTKEKISKSSSVLEIVYTLILNFAFVFFIQIFAIAIVIGSEDNSCDKPIRQWLIVYAVVNGFLIIIYSLSKIKKINEKVRKFLFSYIFIGGGLFNFAWMIVGSVWEFKSDDCYDDFYKGWALTLAILIIDYVIIGLVCCIGCCCCILIIEMRKLDKEDMEENEKELENCVNELKNTEPEAQSKAQAETNEEKGKVEEEEEEGEGEGEKNQV